MDLYLNNNTNHVPLNEPNFLVSGKRPSASLHLSKKGFFARCASGFRDALMPTVIVHKGFPKKKLPCVWEIRRSPRPVSHLHGCDGHHGMLMEDIRLTSGQPESTI